MIDTDKYEGHTPAPWTLSEEYAYELFVYAGDARLAKMDDNAPLHTNEHGNPEDVNAQLIADAPRILQALIDERAEVKRLRSDMAYCASLITCMVDMGDPLSLFVVREGMLDSIGMTVDEAMATTDLMGDEQE